MLSLRVSRRPHGTQTPRKQPPFSGPEKGFPGVPTPRYGWIEPRGLSENGSYSVVVRDSQNFFRNSPAIPHNSGSQRGIRNIGFEYVHAPERTATASPKGPTRNATEKNNKSVLLCHRYSIEIPINKKQPDRITGEDHRRLARTIQRA